MNVKKAAAPTGKSDAATNRQTEQLNNRPDLAILTHSGREKELPLMERQTAIAEIRASWKRLYPASRDKKGIVCPNCGHGTHGDGIKTNPKSKNNYSLKCFGNCGFSGDIIDLIMRDKGLSFNDALEYAAGELGIEIDKYEPGSSIEQEYAKMRERQQAQKEPEKVTEKPLIDYSNYFAECANKISDKAAAEYLKKRGISESTAKALSIGYDAAWRSPTTIRNMEAQGNEWRPTPTRRIIIPITRSCYVARAIDAGIDERFKKMNETGGGSVGIFHESALFNGSSFVYVTEGAFDALSVIETGREAIALNSTSNVGLLLKKLAERPTEATLIICLDNDDAGRNAADTLREGLDKLNISYIDANIAGKYKDANDALVNDRAAFENALSEIAEHIAIRPDNTSEYIDSLMQIEIDKLKEAAEKKTGFYMLDKLSGGLYPGLYVIAATSSLGKTTFSLQIADNLAAAGNDVLFFSMEQSRLELVSKSLARISAQEDKATALNSLAIRKGYKPESVVAAAKKYKSIVANRVSIIEGNFSCNISFIGEYIRKYIKNNSCRPVVFIDYLQILQPADDSKRATVKETVDNTVTELKRISRELDLTVFIISSVNRANYLTPIDFESLKESGGIEYTADVIWGLQLQCLNEPLFDSANKIKEKRQRVKEAKAATPRKIELQCLKNRYGIANFSCCFDYFPQHDLFEQTPGSDFVKYNGANPLESETKKTIRI